MTMAMLALAIAVVALVVAACGLSLAVYSWKCWQLFARASALRPHDEDDEE